MKKNALAFIALLVCLQGLSQQDGSSLPGNETEQQLENLSQLQESDIEDDSYLQALMQFQKNKLNLNQVNERELTELGLLTPLQIHSLVQYRKLLGELVSVYELQAIPGWDPLTIRKVLPYVRVGSLESFGSNLKQRFLGGQHMVMVRLQQVIEKSAGFIRADSIANRYLGNPQKILYRYKYNYRNLLQFGITGEKDAGEPFFKGNNRTGFDFYSFHMFARKVGPIRSVAMGDFTVNLGQGLIQWQSLAFKKSPDIASVKRQSDILRPYNSAGEYNFMRGAGVTVGIKNLDLTVFGSSRRLDANVHSDTSQTGIEYISSIINSGYHRTGAEISKKNAITQNAFGGSLSLRGERFKIGINAINLHYSTPIDRNDLPYNQYAISGRNWHNYSVDYSYTYRNYHFFGEVARDKNNGEALLLGMLASLDAKLDASVVYRNIEKSYQSFYGNAFTESVYPTNEKGLYTGLSFRPLPYFRIDVYSDVFSFPWLRYRVDAPSFGSEQLVQLTYKAGKRFEAYTRFRNENKGINRSGDSGLRQVYNIPKQNWRTHITLNINSQFTYSQRVEVAWYDHYKKGSSQQGFLMYVDGRYKSFRNKLGLAGRFQYFETDGFDSRLYAYESDVLYSFTIPQFMGKGFRYYVNANYDISKKIAVWLRWSQTIFADQETIGSGLDQIEGNKKSEIKLQALYSF